MKSLFFSTALLLLSAPSLAELTISGAYVPEAPPTARVMTAYMKLTNPTDTATVISAIESPQFKRIEMHTTELKDGVASMKKLPGLSVKDVRELKPGGAHLMMFNPTSRLKKGDSVDFILTFDDGSTQRFQAKVEKRKVEQHHHHHH